MVLDNVVFQHLEIVVVDDWRMTLRWRSLAPLNCEISKQGNCQGHGSEFSLAYLSYYCHYTPSLIEYLHL